MDDNNNYIGHVEKLYKLEGCTDPNRAIVKWYFKQDELTKLSRRNVTCKDPWRELFLPLNEDACNSLEDIDAETISKKCFVQRLNPQDSIPDVLCDQDSSFYVRYGFDSEYNLHPLNRTCTKNNVLQEASPWRKEDLFNGSSRTPNCTPRRTSRRTQNRTEEFRINSSGKTRRKMQKGNGRWFLH